jgi:hypothetical protein
MIFGPLPETNALLTSEKRAILAGINDVGHYDMLPRIDNDLAFLRFLLSLVTRFFFFEFFSLQSRG